MKNFYNFGPFTVSKHRVNRGDGKWWTAYELGYKMHKFQNAGPDRFVMRYETKMQDWKPENDGS